jgi:hypothetical protein
MSIVDIIIVDIFCWYYCWHYCWHYCWY